MPKFRVDLIINGKTNGYIEIDTDTPEHAEAIAKKIVTFKVDYAHLRKN